MANVQRFIYSGSAVGVGAVLTSPVLAESWAPAALPIIGGRSRSEAGPVVWPDPADPVLKFDRAVTEITGVQTGAEEYTTTIWVEVTNLNILHWVTGSVDITFTWKYRAKPKAQRHLDTVDVSITSNLGLEAQPFAGISIQGVNLGSMELGRDIYQKTGQAFKDFKKDQGANSINEFRPGQNYRHPQGKSPNGHGQGLIFTALAQPVNKPIGPPLNYDEFSHGRVDVPGIPDGGSAEVYLGEWWGEPYRQSLTLLRVKLKNVRDRDNPRGTFSGDIVVDESPGGTGFP